MEVATWNGPNIHRSSLALGLRSEASGRFEKGLQPEQCMHAQAIATLLMIELCGARVAPGTIDLGLQGEGWIASRPTIRLREARVQAILGVPVARERQAQILAALDFATQPADDGLDVTVPALRRDDVTREIDLIEEVARIDGVERLPATLPARRGAAGRLTHAQRVRRAAEDALVGRGLHEIVGWSFADPQLLDRLRLGAASSPEGDHPLRRVVTLENPLSESQSILRPTLLGSLLDAARHNVSRNGPDIAIFESGTVYRAHADAPSEGRAGHAPSQGHATRDFPADEHHGLGALLSGRLAPRSWRSQPVDADFFAAKALLEALLARFGLDWSVAPDSWPFLHPGRSAAVIATPSAGSTLADTDGDEPVRLGFVGELHPLVAGAWDLQRTAAFAIDLGMLAALTAPVVEFTAFGPFPPLRQDLAVTLPELLAGERVLEAVRAAAGEILDEVSVFDVYTGEQVGEGRRSLALALSFRALERTLTDEDIEPVRARIVAALEQLGGELRG
jgi:phenylalanyl-tRNA synthetase beta chain